MGAASVFHKTRLSDIPCQRLHKAIHCLASAQPTDRPPQSSRKIGLREAGRLADPLRPFGPPPLLGEVFCFREALIAGLPGQTQQVN